MSEIEFGIGFRRLDNIAAEARDAEALGYQFITTGEHVFFHGPTGNGLISLAAAAGATEHIKLMSSITLVPLYPPALLAKQVAALDIVSNGRFHLGVGVGGEFAKEFEACGVPVNERGARTNEALEVMKRLWTEDDVSFDGKFTRLSGLTLKPKPPQEPHPPIWISGRSDAAMRRAAQFGNGWLPYMYTPEKLSESVETIGGYSSEFGREDSVKPGLFIFFAVHADGARGSQMAAERLSLQYNQDFSALVGKYALAGSPDDCVARLKEYIDAGARTIILNSACPADYMGDEDIAVDGTVDGTVALSGHNLTVGPNGRITAEITANSVMVEGHVVGNINAKERIELRAGGSVEGDLAAPRVVLGEGARLKGSVDMQIESGSVSGTWQAEEPTPQSAVTAPSEPVSDELFSDPPSVRISPSSPSTAPRQTSWSVTPTAQGTPSAWTSAPVRSSG